MAEEAEDRDGLYIDGEFYTQDDLTFGEQRKVRQLIKDANADDENFDVNDAALVDLIPAIVTVIKQREDEGFQFHQALDLKPSDLVASESNSEPDPPTPEG